MAKVKDEAPVTPEGASEKPKRDEMHIDDFLNRTESAANRELLAAFAFIQRKKGVVKQELEAWKKDLERFLRAKPE